MPELAIVRYLWQVVQSIFGTLVSLATTYVAANGLGAEIYGVYAYLRTVLQKLFEVTGVGRQIVLFNQSASNSRMDKGLLTIVIIWFVMQLAFIASAIGMAYVSGYMADLLRTTDIRFVLMIFFLEALRITSLTIIGFLNSIGLVKSYTKLMLITGLAKTCLLVVLYLQDVITLYVFIATMVVSEILFVVSIIKNIKNLSIPYAKITGVELAVRKKELVDMGKSAFGNLFQLQAVGVVAILMEIWLVMHVYGSAEYSKYAVSLAVTSVVLVLLTASLPILWRSMRISDSAGEIGRVKVDISDIVMNFSAFYAFLVAFISVNADYFELLFAESYAGMHIVLSVLVLFAVFSGISQIVTHVFYSFEMYRVHSRLSILQHIIGLITTYILVVPDHWLVPGLELGVLGYALKMLLVPYVFSFVRLVLVERRIRGRESPVRHAVRIFIGIAVLLVGWIGVNLFVRLVVVDRIGMNLASFSLQIALLGLILLAMFKYKHTLCGFTDNGKRILADQLEKSGYAPMLRYFV